MYCMYVGIYVCIFFFTSKSAVGVTPDYDDATTTEGPTGQWLYHRNALHLMTFWACELVSVYSLFSMKLFRTNHNNKSHQRIMMM